MPSPATREARLQDLEHTLENDIDGVEYVEVDSVRHIRFWFDDAEAKDEVKSRLPETVGVRYETEDQLVAGVSASLLLDSLLDALSSEE